VPRLTAGFGREVVVQDRHGERCSWGQRAWRTGPSDGWIALNIAAQLMGTAPPRRSLTQGRIDAVVESQKQMGMVHSHRRGYDAVQSAFFHLFWACSPAAQRVTVTLLFFGIFGKKTMVISLEAAIRDLRTQLQKAAAEGANAAIRFVPKAVEVELSMEISKEAEGKASGGLWSIVSLEGSAKASSGNTHTVRLTLEPVDSSGKPALISSSVIPKD
jgi:hypothetical protein